VRVLGGTRVAQHGLRSAVAALRVGGVMFAPVRWLVMIMMSHVEVAVECVLRLPAPPAMGGAPRARRQRRRHRRRRRRPSDRR